MHVSNLRPRRTQAARRAATRAALLEAAARGLSRAGYGNLILEQVASEAGYTRGALYHQFAGKEELALAVVEWVAAMPVGWSSRREVVEESRGNDAEAAVEGGEVVAKREADLVAPAAGVDGDGFGNRRHSYFSIVWVISSITCLALSGKPP